MTPAMSEPAAKGKSKEELLREEVRFYMDLVQKMMQWGITLMVSLQTALFFLRRELVDRMVTSGELQKGEQLPYWRYLAGTAFLLLAALIVSAINKRTVEQYRNYKSQLLMCSESGITDLPLAGVGSRLKYLFFAFPVFDLLIRLYFTVQIHFK